MIELILSYLEKNPELHRKILQELQDKKTVQEFEKMDLRKMQVPRKKKNAVQSICNQEGK